MRTTFRKFHIPTLVAGQLILGGVATAALSLLLNLGQSGVGLGLALGGVLYFLHKEGDRQLPDNNPVIWKLSQATFAVSLVISFVLLATANGYDRPTAYYLALIVGFLALFASSTTAISKRRVYAILSETILLAGLYRTARYYQFITIPGNDINYHIRIAESIAATGGPGVAGRYSSAIIWHILTSVMLNLGLDAKAAINLSSVVPFTVLTILLLYAITTRLSGRVAGLFASVFGACSTMLMVRGVTSLTPSVIVVPLTLGMLYITISYPAPDSSSGREVHKIRFLLLSVFGVAALLTHQLSSLIYVFLVVFIWAASYLYQFLYDRSSKPLLSSQAVLMTGLLMATSWILIQATNDHSLFDTAILRTSRAVLGLGNTSTGYAASLDSYSLLSNLLYLGGYYAILAAGAFGCALWLRTKSINRRRAAILVSIAGLFVLVYPATLAGLDKFLIPHRILVFLSVLLIITGATAIRSSLQSRRTAPVAIMLTILIVSLSLTSPVTHRADPLYDQDRVSRTGLTNSEVAAIQWAAQHADDGQMVYLDGKMYLRAAQNLVSSQPISTIVSYPTRAEGYSSGGYIVDRGRGGDTSTFGGHKNAVLLPQECDSKKLVYNQRGVRVWFVSSECGV